MTTTNTKLNEIIDIEVDQKYNISFFESFLTNYIADFKPAIVSTMSEVEYENYIQQKNDEALQEFCKQIKSDRSITEATNAAIHSLLSDFVE